MLPVTAEPGIVTVIARRHRRAADRNGEIGVIVVCRVSRKGVVPARGGGLAARKARVRQRDGVGLGDVQHRFRVENTRGRRVLHVGIALGVDVRRGQPHRRVPGRDRPERERYRAERRRSAVARERHGSDGVVHSVGRVTAAGEGETRGVVAEHEIRRGVIRAVRRADDKAQRRFLADGRTLVHRHGRRVAPGGERRAWQQRCRQHQRQKQTDRFLHRSFSFSDSDGCTY